MCYVLLFDVEEKIEGGGGIAILSPKNVPLEWHSWKRPRHHKILLEKDVFLIWKKTGAKLHISIVVLRIMCMVADWSKMEIAEFLRKFSALLASVVCYLFC